ncbi:MAG: O-antigen ligase family protein [Desulfobacterales bacterium]|nr:O-antigen ligase family protein [Desulfobacterales bacterium]
MLSSAWLVYKCWDLRGTTGDRFENWGGGVVQDANQFAAALILMLPLVLNKALKKGNNWIRIGASLGAFGMIMSIMLTGSRGGFLGLVGCAIAFIIFFKEYRKKALYLFLALTLVALSYSPEYYVERITGVFSSEKVEEDESSQQRLDAWNLAIEVWLKNPIFGCGMRNFAYYMGYHKEDLDWGELGHVAHSLWFETLGEGGLLLFLPLVFLLALFFTRSFNVRKKSIINEDIITYHEIAALEVGMIGFLIAASFVNRLVYEPIYWWSAMALIHQRFLGQNKEKPTEEKNEAQIENIFELPKSMNNPFT